MTADTTIILPRVAAFVAAWLVLSVVAGLIVGRAIDALKRPPK